jgi:hypothetical protein
MDNNNSLSAGQLVFLSSIVASAISKDLTADQINVLGNFLAAVAAAMLTIAAKLAADQSQLESLKQKEDIKNQIKELKNQLKQLDS